MTFMKYMNQPSPAIHQLVRQVWNKCMFTFSLQLCKPLLLCRSCHICWQIPLEPILVCKGLKTLEDLFDQNYTVIGHKVNKGSSKGTYNNNTILPPSHRPDCCLENGSSRSHLPLLHLHLPLTCSSHNQQPHPRSNLLPS